MTTSPNTSVITGAPLPDPADDPHFWIGYLAQTLRGIVRESNDGTSAVLAMRALSALDASRDAAS